jgi:hypothetical protein
LTTRDGVDRPFGLAQGRLLAQPRQKEGAGTHLRGALIKAEWPQKSLLRCTRIAGAEIAPALFYWPGEKVPPLRSRKRIIFD